MKYIIKRNSHRECRETETAVIQRYNKSKNIIVVILIIILITINSNTNNQYTNDNNCNIQYEQ